MIKKVFVVRSKGGGSKKFLDHFLSFLGAKEDLQLVDSNADVILFNAYHQTILNSLKILKNNHPALTAHRVDGSGKLYGREDDVDEVQSCINANADVTVFQSEFSKSVTFEAGLTSVDRPVRL